MPPGRIAKLLKITTRDVHYHRRILREVDKAIVKHGRGVSTVYRPGPNAHLYGLFTDHPVAGTFEPPKWDSRARKCRIHHWILNVPITFMGAIGQITTPLAPLARKDKQGNVEVSTERNAFTMPTEYGLARCHVMGNKTLKIYMPEIITGNPNLQAVMRWAIESTTVALRDLSRRFGFQTDRDNLKMEDNQQPHFAFLSPLFDGLKIPLEQRVLARDAEGNPVVWIDGSGEEFGEDGIKHEWETDDVKLAEYNHNPGRVLHRLESIIEKQDRRMASIEQVQERITTAIEKQSNALDRLVDLLALKPAGDKPPADQEKKGDGRPDGYQ